MSIVDQIIQDAANELGLDKTGNDQNGAPETQPQQNNQNILQVANDFLAKVQQFKTSIADQIAGQQQENVDENDKAQVDENGNPIQPEQQIQPEGGTTIQTPGGTVIKVAGLGLIKMAAKNIIESEVK